MGLSVIVVVVPPEVSAFVIVVVVPPEVSGFDSGGGSAGGQWV